MRHILAGSNREMLRAFAWSRTLVAFDFDGTLAPIVSDPELAALRTSTRRALASLIELYPCAVISGRARADVCARLSGLSFRSVVGNHGAEPLGTRREVARNVKRWVPALAAGLEKFRGVRIEEKTHSIAIHYRRCRTKRSALAAIEAVVETLADVRVIGGKQVINLLHAQAPHKGLALERERDRLGCDTAIYIGDDDTDEDVFALEQAGRLLAVRVGAKRDSLAAYFLRGQEEVDPLIRELVRLRRSLSSHEPKRA